MSLGATQIVFTMSSNHDLGDDSAQDADVYRQTQHEDDAVSTMIIVGWSTANEVSPNSVLVCGTGGVLIDGVLRPRPRRASF
jgi:hypothetical protein